MKYKFPLFIIALLMFSAVNAQLLRIKTIAGNGDQGYDGDGNSAVAATLSGPLGVAVDAAGNVYIQDFYNFRVRKVNTAGIITTVAGTGLPGFTGDGSIGSSAKLTPYGIAVDKHFNLFISDPTYSVVRKVDSLGIITTIAGNKTYGFAGDGGAATAATLASPYGLTVDGAGNLYIADAGKHVIRKVNAAGKISTVAGVDTLVGYAGDGAAATLARLDSPFAVAVDRKGNLYISDHKNNVIRKVDTAHNISTYAGVAGVYNNSGDGGPATAANLNAPQGIAVDTFGNLYIADAENNVIRKVDTNGIITTVVGDGSLGFGGDKGYAISANLHNPYGVAVDVYGDIYIADANNQRIRVAYNPGLSVPTCFGSSLSIYPNPAKDKFSISGLNKSDRIAVYDLAGRCVSNIWESSGNGVQTFDINGLAPGLYLLQVWDSNGDKIATAKLARE
jgi:trimeric autotransporter adhesin